MAARIAVTGLAYTKLATRGRWRPNECRMQRFQDIKVWQRAHLMVMQVYAVTERFPAEEKFRIVDQLRRAALFVPTNIAEGSKRIFRRDYVRFLNVAEP